MSNPIYGYAAVFFDPSDPEATEFNLGNGVVERVMPGAFDDTLTGGDEVVALLNHDPNYLLARRSVKTLELEVDSKGLKYTTKQSGTSIYRDVAELQERRELKGSSFGFAVTRERFVRDGAKRVREILSVVLRDVGPVTFPSYVGTERNVLIRCVSFEGRCLAPTKETPQLVECRSSILAGFEAMEIATEKQAVEIRCRALSVDN